MDLVDALPYVDRELEDSDVTRALVESMIKQEMLTFDPSAEYHKELSASDKPLSPFLQTELNRIQQDPKQATFDKSRYALSNPEAGDTDLGKWESALFRLKQTIEYQQTWLVNAQLNRTYGPSAWKVHASLQEGLLKQAEFQLGDLQEKQLEINQERKSKQLEAKHELQYLEQQAIDTAKKNIILKAKLKRPGEPMQNASKRSKIGWSYHYLCTVSSISMKGWLSCWGGVDPVLENATWFDILVCETGFSSPASFLETWMYGRTENEKQDAVRVNETYLPLFRFRCI